MRKFLISNTSGSIEVLTHHSIFIDSLAYALSEAEDAGLDTEYDSFKIEFTWVDNTTGRGWGFLKPTIDSPRIT